MYVATTRDRGGIFQPGSPWLTICRAVCGVLQIAGPLHAEEARQLLAIFRNELAKAAIPIQSEDRLDPWHYLTERAGGLVVLSSEGKNILRLPLNRTAQTLISSTMTHWRNNHGQTA